MSTSTVGVLSARIAGTWLAALGAGSIASEFADGIRRNGESPADTVLSYAAAAVPLFAGIALLVGARTFAARLELDVMALGQDAADDVSARHAEVGTTRPWLQAAIGLIGVWLIVSSIGRLTYSIATLAFGPTAYFPGGFHTDLERHFWKDQVMSVAALAVPVAAGAWLIARRSRVAAAIERPDTNDDDGWDDEPADVEES